MKSSAFAFLVLMFGAGATLGTLETLGQIDLNALLFGRQTVAAPPPAEGTLKIPVVVRPLPAFTRLEAAHLIDEKTMGYRYVYVPAGAFGDKRPITDLKEVFGRVLKKDKAVLKAFYEDDFFPEGTRPGIVGGIPPGKRSLVLQIDNIPGVFGLQLYDKLDLLTITSTPLEGEELLSPEDRVETLGRRVVVLAENASVLRPAYIRQVPYKKQGGLLGTKTSYQTRPQQEIVLAVDPSEAPLIMAAIEKGASIMAVARSGRPEDDGAEGAYPLAFRPEPEEKADDSRDDVTVVETIVGTNRDKLYFGERFPLDAQELEARKMAGREMAEKPKNKPAQPQHPFRNSPLLP